MLGPCLSTVGLRESGPCAGAGLWDSVARAGTRGWTLLESTDVSERDTGLGRWRSDLGTQACVAGMVRGGGQLGTLDIVCLLNTDICVCILYREPCCDIKVVMQCASFNMVHHTVVQVKALGYH